MLWLPVRSPFNHLATYLARPGSLRFIRHVAELLLAAHEQSQLHTDQHQPPKFTRHIHYQTHDLADTNSAC